MPKSKHSETDQVLHGEILPPAHVSIASVAEMSPAEFLAAHGVQPPKPKAYRTSEAAMRAVVAEVTKDRSQGCSLPACGDPCIRRGNDDVLLTQQPRHRLGAVQATGIFGGWLGPLSPENLDVGHGLALGFASLGSLGTARPGITIWPSTETPSRWGGRPTGGLSFCALPSLHGDRTRHF